MVDPVDGDISIGGEGPFSLHKALPQNLLPLLPLVSAYHTFEGIMMSEASRRQAISKLLEEPALGEIWLIQRDVQAIGYIAICFGYSIELAGRDAFIDEFYIAEQERGRGLGRRALEAITQRLTKAGVVALHLEVDNDNRAAQTLYERCGFVPRRKYHLMTLDLHSDGH
ncbi:N-acetyltransferase [Pelagibius sp. Alg239-R121]|uniref:GNAT family N-acetyltransferase n=1 Tax=Pelagibius sp. Alg239-R121 TaxID=2993448 RepID=UPI0024A71B0C|nr:GNAT family N-acetyltransferase [Pelagibius sp. Alg239-R121]